LLPSVYLLNCTLFFVHSTCFPRGQSSPRRYVSQFLPLQPLDVTLSLPFLFLSLSILPSGDAAHKLYVELNSHHHAHQLPPILLCIDLLTLYHLVSRSSDALPLSHPLFALPSPQDVRGLPIYPIFGGICY
jgi:hypothetical protein